MKIIGMGDSISVPESVSKCPICGAQIVIEFDEWEEVEASLYTASESGIHPNCITEPDIDSGDWQEWFNNHWRTPYIDWLHVEAKLLSWVNNNFRFYDAGPNAAPSDVTPEQARLWWVV